MNKLLIACLFIFGCGRVKHESLESPKTIEQAWQELLNSEPVLLDTANVHQWPGLDNISNTCFMNATLKLLARQKELFEMLKPQASDSEKTAELRKSFKAIINMIRLGDKSPAKKVVGLSKHALTNFRDTMKKFTELQTFTECQQRDASQFANALDDELGLYKSLKNNQWMTIEAKIGEDGKISQAQVPRTKLNPHNNFFTLLLHNVFSHDSTMEELLQNFSKPTLEERDINNKNITWFRKFYLNLDRSFIVAVAANNFGQMRSNIISTKDKITLDYFDAPASLVANSLNGQNPQDLPKNNVQKVYSVSAMVIRRGDTKGGHFWAYIKGDSGWVEHNDSLVRPFDGSIDDIEKKHGGGVNPQVYVYLYERY